MTKGCKRVHHRQSEKRNLARVEDAFNALLKICAGLPVAYRERFIHLLLEQACSPAGIACYLAWGGSNFSEIRVVFLCARDISEALARPWYEWARALSKQDSACMALEGVIRLIVDLIEGIALEVNQ
jgi:hypothetical protein